MKTLFLFLLGAQVATSAFAQLSISSWTSNGGGSGISTNGQYSVTGTIGQPDAGTMSGGGFTLQGGFWGVIATVQTPGAPYLYLVQTNGVVMLYWEKTATGFVLDLVSTLTGSPASWSEVLSSQYQTNAAHCFITVAPPLPPGNRFYRLRQQGP